jgi:DNA-binding SARP family transcriptional activator
MCADLLLRVGVRSPAIGHPSGPQYRSVRQADALAAYRRARAVLADELGIEPGAALHNTAQSDLARLLRDCAVAVGDQPARHILVRNNPPGTETR